MLDFRLQPENLTKEGIFKIEGTSETLSNQYFKDLIFNKKLYFQGCVDEYEKCPQWSRAGHCTANSDFMFFHCRESCGACGFKSREFKVLEIISKINRYIKSNIYVLKILALNEELQIVDGKQYTDVSASNYSKFELKSCD